MNMLRQHRAMLRQVARGVAADGAALEMHLAAGRAMIAGQKPQQRPAFGSGQGRQRLFGDAAPHVVQGRAQFLAGASGRDRRPTLVVRVRVQRHQPLAAQPVHHALDRRHIHCGAAAQFVLRTIAIVQQAHHGGKLGGRQVERCQFLKDQCVALVGKAQQVTDLRIKNIGHVVRVACRRGLVFASHNPFLPLALRFPAPLPLRAAPGGFSRATETGACFDPIFH